MTTVTVERNDSHLDGEAQRTIGSWEWVQLTYRTLRAGENGDIDLATFDPETGYWTLEDGTTWSDVIIG